MKNKWSKEFPKKEGDYWFYGYRYGKVIWKDTNSLVSFYTSKK